MKPRYKNRGFWRQKWTFHTDNTEMQERRNGNKKVRGTRRHSTSLGSADERCWTIICHGGFELDIGKRIPVKREQGTALLERKLGIECFCWRQQCNTRSDTRMTKHQPACTRDMFQSGQRSPLCTIHSQWPCLWVKEFHWGFPLSIQIHRIKLWTKTDRHTPLCLEQRATHVSLSISSICKMKECVLVVRHLRVGAWYSCHGNNSPKEVPSACWIMLTLAVMLYGLGLTCYQCTQFQNNGDSMAPIHEISTPIWHRGLGVISHKGTCFLLKQAPIRV